MKFTLFFAALLALALVACGKPSAPESPANTENYGSTHEGQPAVGRNPLEE